MKSCGFLKSPAGDTYDLFPLVCIATENVAGDVLVVCRGSKVKSGADSPDGPQSISKILADLIKETLGGENVEVKAFGPFPGTPSAEQIAATLRGLSKGAKDDPCCPAPEPVAPAKPKPRRKAAAKKPARRRR